MESTEQLFATDLNVRMDIVAALDMYQGDFGSDGIQIEEVRESPGKGDVEIVLTNGEVVRIAFTIEDPA